MKKNFSLLVIIAIALGIVVGMTYWAIATIVGVSSIREFFAPIGGTTVVIGLVSGLIATIVVGTLQRKTDLFS